VLLAVPVNASFPIFYYTPSQQIMPASSYIDSMSAGEELPAVRQICVSQTWTDLRDLTQKMRGIGYNFLR
jgi:hypothetical protein